MQKSIIVKIDGRDVEIKKLPLGKYAELLKAIKELPKHVESFKNTDEKNVIAILPTIVGESLPDVIGVLSIATPLSADEINELGLDDAVKLVVAIFEVNNYQEVFASIKKAMAQQAPKK